MFTELINGAALHGRPLSSLLPEELYTLLAWHYWRDGCEDIPFLTSIYEGKEFSFVEYRHQLKLIFAEEE